MSLERVSCLRMLPHLLTHLLTHLRLLTVHLLMGWHLYLQMLWHLRLLTCLGLRLTHLLTHLRLLMTHMGLLMSHLGLCFDLHLLTNGGWLERCWGCFPLLTHTHCIIPLLVALLLLLKLGLQLCFLHLLLMQLVLQLLVILHKQRCHLYHLRFKASHQPFAQVPQSSWQPL